MCPLRFILIFLSATLAGFYLLRNLKSDPTLSVQDDAATDDSVQDSPKDHVDRSSKVSGTIVGGFWTLVDMASGRYLWRNLVSSSSSSSSKKAN